MKKNDKVFAEFELLAGDLLNNPQVLRLKEFSHHIGCSRYEHSVNVAYFSYRLAKKLGWDYRSALRGGLLHDLFFYEFKDSDMGPIKHSSVHPKIAYMNAKKICDINEIEKDIITKHMWLANYRFPRYKEAYVVTAVDKYCAVAEAAHGICYRLFKKKSFA